MESSEVTCLRKWGGSTTDAILDPTCQIFRLPNIEGLIGYRAENGCAIVFGDPICPEWHVKNLIQGFHEYCVGKDLKIVYLIVSEEFARWLLENGYCKSIIEYGEELLLDPHDDPREKSGVYASLVRRKVRHALREGVSAQEYNHFNEQTEEGINLVKEKWLGGRKGPQIHISHPYLFDHREGKRWFYAEKEGQILGVVTLNRLDKHQGWLLNHLMFTPEAPAGVPELLVVTAIEALSKEGCRYVTFGTIPGDRLGEITGLGTISQHVARGIYNLANFFFRLNGKKMFWKKFDPVSKKAFLSFSDSRIGLKTVIALTKTLNVNFKGSNGDH